ncbi:MAG: FtsX-like permease family protein [Myxococcota bacterium]
MPILIAMAWRNLWRHQLRTWLTALAMGAVAAIVMWLLSLQGGIRDVIERVGVTEALGHAVVQHPEYARTQSLYDIVEDADAVLATLDDLPGTVAVAPRLNGNALLGSTEKTTGAVLQGIVPVREYALTGLDDGIVEGTALTDEPDGSVMLGVGLAESLDAEVGTELVAVTQDAQGGLGNALYTVVGILETGDPIRDRSSAVLHLADLQELLALPDAVHDITLTTDAIDADVVEPWVGAVQTALSDAELRVRPWWELRPELAQLLGLQSSVSLIMVGVFLGISALVVVNSMLMSVYERTREFGVLRAMGLKPRNLVALVFFESFFLGLLAGALGLAIGAAVVTYTTTVGLDLTLGDGSGVRAGRISFDPIIYGVATVPVFLLPVLVAFACALLAGVLPAARVAAIRPIEALRHG